MARSKKKKAFSQKVVGVATTGMPAPLRNFLTNRLVALLIVLVLPVLLAAGIVSIDWENGRPRLSFDRQKASEVKQNATEKIQELRSERNLEQDGILGILPQDHAEKHSGFTLDLQPNGEFGNRFAEGGTEARDATKPRISLLPTTAEKDRQDGQEIRPVPRLKQLFKR